MFGQKTQTGVVCPVGLIFLSIAYYAGADVWMEAAILALIFALGVWLSFRRDFSADREIKGLLAPIYALAFYSFAQGLLTLFVLNGTLPFSAALPYSFDLAASFWCALKFLALAVFIKILLVDLRAGVRFLIWSLVIIGNFFALLGIFRFLLQAGFPETFGWFILPELHPGVGFGTFINQNHFAFLMLMNLGLSGGLCAYGRLEKTHRSLLFIFSLLTWISIILTASRGGIISSFIVVAALILSPVFGFDRDKNRLSNQDILRKTISFGKKLAAVAALFLLFILGIVFFGQDRVVHRFEQIPVQLENVPNAGGFSRIEVWQAALSIFEAHRLFGVGFGGFRFAVSQYIDISGAVSPGQAHNDYLELAASAGLIGILGGVWFLFKFFAVLKQRFSEPSSRFETAARIGAVCAFAGIAVHSFFDFGLQYIGNWLFFAALLSIAVYKPKANEKNGNDRIFSANPGIRKSLQIGLLIYLCLSSLFFAYSRLENSLARKKLSLSWVQDDFVKLPFDTDFYETRAFINEKAGNLDATARDLQKAIDYRPKDYGLRLKQGKILAALKKTEAAEIAFRQAIQLAPRYGETHFYYGKFLVANSRKTEGFGELRFAVQRNPQYFAKVFALAWRESEENADETIRLLSPLAATEKEKLAEILLDKKEYAALAQLVCREEDLSKGKRDELITKLFEKRQFRYASQIFDRDCERLNSGAANLFDGGFETGELREGFGFGWRVRDLPDAIKIGFDNKKAASGNRSLEFVFNGNFEPLLPLVSQALIVEKNRQYLISFAYRTEKIKTGGVPVLQLIFRQPDADIVYKEIKLTGEENVWNRISVTIQTSIQTDVMEIRLARQSCNQRLCPIYGRLWLDDFVLK